MTADDRLRDSGFANLYPYEMFNAERLGSTSVAVNGLGMLVAFILLCVAFIALSTRTGRLVVHAGRAAGYPHPGTRWRELIVRAESSMRGAAMASGPFAAHEAEGSYLQKKLNVCRHSLSTRCSLVSSG